MTRNREKCRFSKSEESRRHVRRQFQIQLLSNESSVKVEQGEGSGGGSGGGVPPNSPAKTAGTDGSVGVVSPWGHTLRSGGSAEKAPNPHR